MSTQPEPFVLGDPTWTFDVIRAAMEEATRANPLSCIAFARDVDIHPYFVFFGVDADLILNLQERPDATDLLQLADGRTIRYTTLTQRDFDAKSIAEILDAAGIPVVIIWAIVPEEQETDR